MRILKMGNKCKHRGNRAGVLLLATALTVGLLAGCGGKEAPATSLQAVTQPQTTCPVRTPAASTQVPTQPQPTWPAEPAEGSVLFQTVVHNGSLQLCWEQKQAADGDEKNFWLEDRNGGQYYVDEMERELYRAKFWLRVELTEAGRHYCDETWTLSLEPLTQMECGSADGRVYAQPLNIQPYYQDADHTVLGGWVLYGYLHDPADFNLTLTGEGNTCSEIVSLAPGFASTVMGQNLFDTEELAEKPQVLDTLDSVVKMDLNGKTVYMGAASAQTIQLTPYLFLVTPQQQLLEHLNSDLENMQAALYVRPYEDPFADAMVMKLTASISLYADPEGTELVGILVCSYYDSYWFTLCWEDGNCMQAYSEIVYRKNI